MLMTFSCILVFTGNHMLGCEVYKAPTPALRSARHSNMAGPPSLKQCSHDILPISVYRYIVARYHLAKKHGHWLKSILMLHAVNWWLHDQHLSCIALLYECFPSTIWSFGRIIMLRAWAVSIWYYRMRGHHDTNYTCIGKPDVPISVMTCLISWTSLRRPCCNNMYHISPDYVAANSVPVLGLLCNNLNIALRLNQIEDACS